MPTSTGQGDRLEYRKSQHDLLFANRILVNDGVHNSPSDRHSAAPSSSRPR